MIASLLLSLFFAAKAVPVANNLSGDWKTSDNSIVRVYACNGSELCARVIAVGPKNEPPGDVQNPDASLRARQICGLTVGTGFTPDGSDLAKDGKIYDPKSGKTYSAQMQSSGDTLKLHGYIGISLLGRTETWHRVANSIAVCQ